LNARQAGHRDPEIAIFYADLHRRFEPIPGVRSATLSQSSIVNAGPRRALDPEAVNSERCMVCTHRPGAKQVKSMNQLVLTMLAEASGEAERKHS
jgi:hypothetical protein